MSKSRLASSGSRRRISSSTNSWSNPKALSVNCFRSQRAPPADSDGRLCVSVSLGVMVVLKVVALAAATDKRRWTSESGMRVDAMIGDVSVGNA